MRTKVNEPEAGVSHSRTNGQPSNRYQPMDHQLRGIAPN
jgi:hypothetical protein